MNINLNVPLTMMTRLIDAIEQYASDYRKVHAADLENYERWTRAAKDDTKGKFFYQSDHDLYEAEQSEKSELVDIV